MKNKVLSLWFTLLIVVIIGIDTTQAQISESTLKEKCEYESRALSTSNGYPFHGATTFNDYVYAVQIYNTSRGEIRVYKFEDEDEDGFPTEIYNTKVTGGGVYQDAEIVSWGGYLIVLWKNNTNGDIDMACSTDGETFVKCSTSVEKEKTYLNFAAFVYNNKLCVASHRRSDDKIHIKYADFADIKNLHWENFSTVKDGSNDNVTFDGSKSIQPNHTNKDSKREDAWDADTWMGKGTDGKMTEMIVVGRVEDNKFEAYTYNSEMSSKTAANWHGKISTSGAPSNCFYLKLIEGSVSGVTAVNTLPMQYIFATDASNSQEILLKEFLPQMNKFSDSDANYIDLPYGYYGVTTSNVMVTDDLINSSDPHRFFRQKINIFRGNGPTYHCHGDYAAILNSNLIKGNYSEMADKLELLKEPSLRCLITFEGLIEGPPPSLISNAEWFEYRIDKLQGAATSVKIGNNSEDSQSTKNGVSLKMKPEFGPDTELFTARLGLSCEFLGYKESEESYSSFYDYEVEAKEEESYKATLFYSIPQLRRYGYYLWNCDEQQGELTASTPMYEYRFTGFDLVPIPYDLSLNPFRVDNAMDARNWYNRDMLIGAYNIPSQQKLSLTSTLGVGSQTKGFDQSTSVTTHFETTDGFVMDVDVEIFAVEEEVSYLYESETTNTIGSSFEFAMNEISESIIPEGVTPKYETITVNGYVMTNETTDILRSSYYPSMQGAMVEYKGYEFQMLYGDEKPYVIAWDVSSLAEINKLSSPTSVDQLLSDYITIRSISSGIVIESEQVANVTIYDITGLAVYKGSINVGENQIQLARNFYIVELTNDADRLVRKISVK